MVGPSLGGWIGVRMHSGETVEAFLRAHAEGLGTDRSAEAAGNGRLSRSYAGES